MKTMRPIFDKNQSNICVQLTLIFLYVNHSIMRLNQDMKGFAVTPIVFIGLFIITGLMLVSFSDLDRKLVDGISKVSSIKTLEAGFLSNKTSTENILYLQSVFGLEKASTQAQLQENISRLVEDSVTITSCQTPYFTTKLT